MPRSHQTRSQYVLQNVAERGQTVCERNERCDNYLESVYELNGCFMDAVDGLEREGLSRTSRNPEETIPFRNWTEWQRA